MSNFVSQWQEWHDTRVRNLADPYGWLALVSLDWLDDTPRTYGELPGLWWQDTDAAYVDPQGGHLVHDGKPVTGVHRFELVNSGDGTRVVAGDVEIEVARRSGYLLRVHDPKAKTLADFKGVPSYEPKPEWVLKGRYEAYDEPKPTTVGAVVEGLSHVYEVPGVVRFEYDGTEHTLAAFNGKKSGLNILFTDATSGVTTYGAVRSVAVDLPAEGDEVAIDFTRATNLPCAFTEFATCPVPPQGNRLPFAVEAGEKTPY